MPAFLTKLARLLDAIIDRFPVLRSSAVIATLGMAVVAIWAQSLYGTDDGRVSVSAGFVSPQICPPATSSGSSNVTTTNVVTAAGDDAQVKALTRTAKTLVRAERTSKSLRVQTPVTVSGAEHTAMLSAARVQVWIAARTCQAPSIDTWFVGGSGSIDSQSRVSLTNDGASDATIEISGWTANGPTTAITSVVSARSSAVISVDRFALGSSAVAVRVRALSGRVAASLFDVRARGLTPLGADFVPMGVEPLQRQVIVGLVGGVPKAKLRLLAPGVEDAVVRVDLVTGEDRFTPSGLDEVDLPAGQVVDVDLPLQGVSGAGALVIDANVPVVAGLYQPGGSGKRDFAWLASSRPLGGSTLALPSQFSSTLVLFAPARTTSITSTGIARRDLPAIAIKESSIVTSALTAPRWILPNDQVYAAVLSRTSYGISVDPLNPLTRSRARITPLPAISVITPR